MSKELDLSQFLTDEDRRMAEGYSRRLREGKLRPAEKKRHEERMLKYEREREYTKRTGLIRISEHH